MIISDIGFMIYGNQPVIPLNFMFNTEYEDLFTIDFCVVNNSVSPEVPRYYYAELKLVSDGVYTLDTETTIEHY